MQKNAVLFFPKVFYITNPNIVWKYSVRLRNMEVFSERVHSAHDKISVTLHVSSLDVHVWAVRKCSLIMCVSVKACVSKVRCEKVSQNKLWISVCATVIPMKMGMSTSYFLKACSFKYHYNNRHYLW